MCVQRDMYRNVCCSIVENSEKLQKERKYPSGVDLKCDIYTAKRDELDLYTSTWIDLQNLMLNRKKEASCKHYKE